MSEDKSSRGFSCLGKIHLVPGVNMRIWTSNFLTSCIRSAGQQAFTGMDRQSIKSEAGCASCLKSKDVADYLHGGLQTSQQGQQRFSLETSRAALTLHVYHGSGPIYCVHRTNLLRALEPKLFCMALSMMVRNGASLGGHSDTSAGDLPVPSEVLLYHAVPGFAGHLVPHPNSMVQRLAVHAAFQWRSQLCWEQCQPVSLDQTGVVWMRSKKTCWVADDGQLGLAACFG